jgi:hypothetical protein
VLVSSGFSYGSEASALAAGTLLALGPEGWAPIEAAQDLRAHRLYQVGDTVYVISETGNVQALDIDAAAATARRELLTPR